MPEKIDKNYPQAVSVLEENGYVFSDTYKDSFQKQKNITGPDSYFRIKIVKYIHRPSRFITFQLFPTEVNYSIEFRTKHIIEDFSFIQKMADTLDNVSFVLANNGFKKTLFNIKMIEHGGNTITLNNKSIKSKRVKNLVYFGLRFRTNFSKKKYEMFGNYNYQSDPIRLDTIQTIEEDISSIALKCKPTNYSQ